jgi:hypothetical protein
VPPPIDRRIIKIVLIDGRGVTATQYGQDDSQDQNFQSTSEGAGTGGEPKHDRTGGVEASTKESHRNKTAPVIINPYKTDNESMQILKF